MELSSECDSGVDISDYKTPIQKLARRWKESVELWKSKYLEVKATINYYQNLAADARRSRDHWKEKFEQMKTTLTICRPRWIVCVPRLSVVRVALSKKNGRWLR